MVTHDLKLGRDSHGTAVHRQSQTELRIGLTLAVILSLVPYLMAPGFSFVNWDDGEYVTNRTQIHHGFTWSSVSWAFSTYECANWHPMTWLSYMAETQIWGVSSTAMHSTNMALHCINTLLVGLVVYGYMRQSFAAVFCSVIFAVHPQHVEVVAWVSERKELLCITFGLCSILAWKQFRETGSYVALCISYAMFACSLLAKQMLITLPFLLLVLEACPMKQGENQISLNRAISAFKWILGFFALTGYFTWRVFQAQEDGGAISSLAVVPIWIRLCNAVQSVCLYVVQTVAPLQLSPFYTHPLEATSINLSICCALALLAATWFVWRNRSVPGVVAGSLWFLGTLVPVLGLVQLGSASRADRYTYFPHIGLFIATSSLIDIHLQRYRRFLIPAIFPVAVVLAIICSQQAQCWSNSIALWSQCLRCDPDNYLGHEMLALAYLTEDDVENGLKHSKIAIRYSRNRINGSTYTSLGCALLFSGDVQGAILNLREAIRLSPHDHRALINLGYALHDTDLAAAKQLFTEAIKYSPDNAEAIGNLANCEAEEGNLTKALELLRKAMKIAPDNEKLKENYLLYEEAEKELR